jgi:hypothetical protein
VVIGTPSCRPRGIALVDVIVGTVMLGVVLVVVIGLTSNALSAQEHGERLQTVAMLLDEQLSLVVVRGPDQYASRFDAEGQCDAPFGAYRYALDLSGGTSGDPYRVVATISWVERGSERSESAETLVAPRLGEDPDPDRKPGSPVERYQ